VPGFHEAILEFRSALGQLSKKLLRSFGLYMELEDPNYLVERHRAIEDPTVVSINGVRSNFYMAMEPEFPVGKDVLRLREHKDWSTLTFLIQDDAGGLEVKGADGHWIPVTPIKGSIVLNVGLMLEMWSGGLFPATVSKRLHFSKLIIIYKYYYI